MSTNSLSTSRTTPGSSTIRTARAAGAWYLALALTGSIGFLVLDPMLFVNADPAASLSNLQAQPELAHLRVALELGVCLSQAMAALWFGKLFRPTNPMAATAVTAFGIVNAVVLLFASVFLAGSVAVAGDPSLAPGGDAAATVALLHSLDALMWDAGGIFFGLWLIPMGWMAIVHRRFPRALGWFLAAGGVGYVLSTFVGLGLAGTPTWLPDLLPLPATVGELWMVGYLLIKGIRPDSHPAVSVASA